MEKELIKVYVDPELKRRVEEAAAKHNVAVNEYWLDAVEQKLADEPVVEGEGTETPVKRRGLSAELLYEMRELRESILARRGGKPIDIDVLEQLRSERDDELTGMR